MKGRTERLRVDRLGRRRSVEDDLVAVLDRSTQQAGQLGSSSQARRDEGGRTVGGGALASLDEPPSAARTTATSRTSASERRRMSTGGMCGGAGVLSLGREGGRAGWLVDGGGRRTDGPSRRRACLCPWRAADGHQLDPFPSTRLPLATCLHMTGPSPYPGCSSPVNRCFDPLARAVSIPSCPPPPGAQLSSSVASTVGPADPRPLLPSAPPHPHPPARAMAKKATGIYRSSFPCKQGCARSFKTESERSRVRPPSLLPRRPTASCGCGPQPNQQPATS